MAWIRLWLAGVYENRITGLTATKYKEDGNEYDVIVRYDEKYRHSTDDIENISIMTPKGNSIKVSEITQLKHYYAPPNIVKRE